MTNIKMATPNKANGTPRLDILVSLMVPMEIASSISVLTCASGGICQVNDNFVPLNILLSAIMFPAPGESMVRPKEPRNREIFAAHLAGKSRPWLAENYSLALNTVDFIIRNEGHKHDVCVDKFYSDACETGNQ
jgi:hypothetical protein